MLLLLGSGLDELTDTVKIGGMEKRTPHYRLVEIKAAVASRGFGAFTRQARLDSVDMGLSPAQALATVADLARGDFRKSMTTYNDHRIWQDVYTAATP